MQKSCINGRISKALINSSLRARQEKASKLLEEVIEICCSMPSNLKISQDFNSLHSRMSLRACIKLEEQKTGFSIL